MKKKGSAKQNSTCHFFQERKKGIAGELLLAIGLVALLALIFLLFAGQQREKTETSIGALWKRIFPSKTETITIPGTTAGGGCPTIYINSAEMAAQAAIDCWKQGKMYDDEVVCCYILSAERLEGEIYKSNLLDALRKHSELGKELADALCGGFQWKISVEKVPIQKGAYPVTVCFNEGMLCDDVFFTYNPESDCSE
ncbi:MAG: hypothetical protein QW165_03710 [Candidatus Woesearchaeota archaeon]